MIDIGAVTDRLLEVLVAGAPDVVIGDGVAPESGGWSGGTPNVQRFVAYSVLGFSGAVPANPSVAANEPEWATSWSLRHYGASRRQADIAATAVRSSVINALQEVVGVDDPFKVIGVSWSTLGMLQRIDTTDPPFWSASDGCMLTLSRVRIPRP